MMDDVGQWMGGFRRRSECPISLSPSFFFCCLIVPYQFFFFFLCDVSDFAYIVRQYSLSNWISQVIFMSFVKFSVGFLLSKGRDDDAAGD